MDKATTNLDLRALMERHGMPILVAALDGKVAYASPACEKVIGLSRAEIENSDIWLLNPAFNREEISAHLRERGVYELAVGSGSPVESTLYRVTFSAEPSQIDQSGFLVAFQNLARLEGDPARFAFEEDLRTRSLEAIGKVTAKIGHDFNNLLGSVLGCLDLIDRKIEAHFPNENPFVRQRAIVDSALKRAIGLSSKIRGFVRPGPLNLVRGNLQSCIESVVQLLAQNGVTKEEIDVNIGANPAVEISEFSVCQILMSICLNALEAMKGQKDRQVILYVEEVELNESFTRYLRAGKYARLSVMDHGEGISEEDKHKLFEPFFSTKDGVGKGLGLSLAMAREVMKKHNGDLFLLSEPECGTVVHLYFPVAE